MIRITFLILAIAVAGIRCRHQNQPAFQPKEVYKSKTLIISQIAENSFVHTSFLQTNDFGNVPCNGLIVRNAGEVVIYNTPTNDGSSEELITWIINTLRCNINAVVPTHFHNDCLGGLKAFDQHGIPSYALFKTIELAKQNNYVVPKNSFRDSLALPVGDQQTLVKFLGEGHTIDNVVGYFPADRVMFGGCLIKELDANKGYLGDANVDDWSSTVERVKKEYPNVVTVVPGHGKFGNSELLDYTTRLFQASR